ncbi:MAG: CPBP family intramembrane metalloprotease [Clostridia bacterium]|nr:CPBP family intramembrane metalloprotease [Clostridia bacterium]
MNENYNEQLNKETFGESVTSTPEVFIPYFSPEEKEKREEKRKLKKVSNTVGISLLAVTVFTFLLSLGLSFLSILILALTGKSDVLSTPAVNETVNILYSIAVFGGIVTAVFKLSHYRISDLVSFKKTEKGLVLPLFFFGIAFCAFGNIAASYMDAFFEGIGIDYAVPEIEKPDGIFGFLLTIIATAIVPALLEEFAFRGIILGSLRKFGDTFALIASSICFGVLHSNFEQIPFAFFVGLFLGFAVLKTGSLRVSIAVHFYNNLMSVLINYLPDSVPNEVKNISYVIILLITLVIGIFMLSRVDKDFFAIEKSETVLTEKEKQKTFLTSGFILAFLIINLVQACLYIVI